MRNGAGLFRRRRRVGPILERRALAENDAAPEVSVAVRAPCRYTARRSARPPHGARRSPRQRRSLESVPAARARREKLPAGARAARLRSLAMLLQQLSWPPRRRSSAQPPPAGSERWTPTGVSPCCGRKRSRSSGPSGGSSAAAGAGRRKPKLGGRAVAARSTGTAFDRSRSSKINGPIRWPKPPAPAAQLSGKRKRPRAAQRPAGECAGLPRRRRSFLPVIALLRPDASKRQRRPPAPGQEQAFLRRLLIGCSRGS